MPQDPQVADLLGRCTDSKGCAGWVVGGLNLEWRVRLMAWGTDDE